MLIEISKYVLAIALVLLFARLSELDKFTESLKQLFIIISFSISILFNGLRFDVGIDHSIYAAIFKFFSSGDTLAIIEPGYTFLNLLFSKFDYPLGLSMVYFTCSFITFLFLYKHLIRNNILSVGLFLAYTLGFVFYANTQVRQFIAVAIFLWSIRFITDKQLGYYLLAILGASMFHFSAIVLLPFYYINRFKFFQSPLKTALFFGVIIILTYLGFFTVIMDILARNTPYARHLENEEYVSGFNFGGIYIIWIMNFLVLLLYKNTIVSNNKNGETYYNLLYIGIAIIFISLDLRIIYRFSNYFQYLTIPCFSFLIKNKQKDKLLFYAWFILYPLLYMMHLMASNFLKIIPYKTIFNFL